MKNLYLYVTKDNYKLCIKYGIKLSEFTDKALSLPNSIKKGIISYLSPKDSDKYFDNNYVCIKVNSDNLSVLIYDKAFENTDFLDEKICRLEDYTLGEYEDPIALICSTVLPENIFLYNKKLDSPLLVEYSKDFYYSKCINEMIENSIFSNEDLFQVILNLGIEKGIFKTVSENSQNMGLNIIENVKNNKKYISKKR